MVKPTSAGVAPQVSAILNAAAQVILLSFALSATAFAITGSTFFP
jgi:hypothetical protein